MSDSKNFQEGDRVIVDNGTIGPVLKGSICGYFSDHRDIWIVKLDNPSDIDCEYSCMCFDSWMITRDQNAPVKVSFEETLKNIRDSFRIMRTHCIGLCEVLKHEGPRSYTERAPIKNDVCTSCKKPIYKHE